jgi:hypothetical protein
MTLINPFHRTAIVDADHIPVSPSLPVLEVARTCGPSDA